jgi:hypothetical protein
VRIWRTIRRARTCFHSALACFDNQTGGSVAAVKALEPGVISGSRPLPIHSPPAIADFETATPADLAERLHAEDQEAVKDPVGRRHPYDRAGAPQLDQ